MGILKGRDVSSPLKCPLGALPATGIIIEFNLMEYAMKKLLITVVALFSLTMLSATPAWAADTKMGIINMQELLQKLPQMKEIGDSLKKQFADRTKQFTDAQAAFKKDAEDFNKNGAVMSATDKQTAEQKLMKQQQDLQQMQSSLMRDSQEAQNKAVDGLLKQIKEVVGKVATKDGLDVVFIDAAAAYTSSNVMNITDAVFQQMPKK